MELDEGLEKNLLDMIKFGSKDDKFNALIEIGEAKGINFDIVSPTLNSVIEESQDELEKLAAAMSLVKLGDTSLDFVNRLLAGLDFLINNPDVITSDTLFENLLLKALSTLKGNVTVINKITESIKNCNTADNSKLLIDPCLRALGVLGDESSREFLEFWANKGNLAATSALNSFGEKWDVIFEGEIAQDEDVIGTFTCFMAEGLPMRDKLKFNGWPCKVYLTNYRIVVAQDKHNPAIFKPKLVIASKLSRKKKEQMKQLIPINILKENPKNFSISYEEIDRINLVKRVMDTWKIFLFIGDIETPKYSFTIAPSGSYGDSYVKRFSPFLNSFFAPDIFSDRIITKF